MIVGFFAVWAKVIMLHRSNIVKQIFDFIMCVFLFRCFCFAKVVFFRWLGKICVGSCWFFWVSSVCQRVLVAWFSCSVWQFGTQKKAWTIPCPYLEVLRKPVSSNNESPTPMRGHSPFIRYDTYESIGTNQQWACTHPLNLCYTHWNFSGFKVC